MTLVGDVSHILLFQITLWLYSSLQLHFLRLLRVPAVSSSIVHCPHTMSRKKTGREGLLVWIQGRTVGYKNVNVVDFTYSWVDGMQYCVV